MKIDIQRAEKADIAALALVVNETWRADYKNLLSAEDIAAFTDEELRIKSFDELFDSGADIFCVRVDSEICGVCTAVKARENWLSDYCEIMQLYILPKIQRIGLGRKLLSHTLRAMRAKGYKSAYLWKMHENIKAEAFYRKFGFKSDEITESSDNFKNPVIVDRYSIEL